MLEEFLAHSHTQALCDKDFTEWHQGIPYYGFWAILIETPDHLSLVSKAQSHLKQFFLPTYKRQAHITLNACGLMAETHFSQAKLAQQMLILKSLDLTAFSLSIGQIDSFSTAAYLSIIDQDNTLMQINQALSEVANDSPPTRYKPHITLGLYQKSYESKRIAEQIVKFEKLQLDPFRVNELQFCRYMTAEIQGPIEIVKRIQLQAEN